MYSESAEWYDRIYAHFKDYAGEAARVAAVIRRIHPGAVDVLDVACGTGEHAHFLHTRFGYSVDGIDIEPEFVRIAAQKVAGGAFTCTDMVDFDLQRRYDVVTCLFSSIGYAVSSDRLVRTLRSFRKHVRPEGFVLVEPWFPPGALQHGKLHLVTFEEESLKGCRLSRLEIREGRSYIHFEYLVGRPEEIVSFREVHELGLFTRDEMMSAFDEAGLAVQFDPDGISGRGLYIAKPVS